MRPKKALEAQYEYILDEESQRRLDEVFDFIFSKISKLKLSKEGIDTDRKSVYTLNGA